MSNLNKRLEKLTGMNEFPKFNLYDKVYAGNPPSSAIKSKGYSYSGIIIARFYTTKNKLRYVVEADHVEYEEILHIFSEEQLSLR